MGCQCVSVMMLIGLQTIIMMMMIAMLEWMRCHCRRLFDQVSKLQVRPTPPSTVVLSRPVLLVWTAAGPPRCALQKLTLSSFSFQLRRPLAQAPTPSLRRPT